jgi:hypothetical protein
VIIDMLGTSPSETEAAKNSHTLFSHKIVILEAIGIKAKVVKRRIRFNSNTQYANLVPVLLHSIFVVSAPSGDLGLGTQSRVHTCPNAVVRLNFAPSRLNFALLVRGMLGGAAVGCGRGWAWASGRVNCSWRYGE